MTDGNIWAIQQLAFRHLYCARKVMNSSLFSMNQTDRNNPSLLVTNNLDMGHQIQDFYVTPFTKRGDGYHFESKLLSLRLDFINKSFLGGILKFAVVYLH